MIRYRQIYNIWGLFAGPAPATGYTYADFNLNKHNNSQLSIFDVNLTQSLDRINAFQYGFDITRNDFKQLGQRGLVDSLIVNRPSVQVNFNYWMIGIGNEIKLGMVGNYLDINGQPVLNQEVSFLHNFTGQQTDYRNLFLAVSPDNDDINNRIGNNILSGQSNALPSGLYVLGFGNCYINSYQIKAQVGTIPQASVGYVCDNAMGFVSGSGVNIPAVLPKTGNLVENVYFTIPRVQSIKIPSVIRPGDITLRIGNLTGTDITESNTALFGIGSSGMPIQSFDLGITLEREDLRSIGYVLPIDRRLNLPAFGTLNISTKVDNNISGNLTSILQQNRGHDILINMCSPSCGITGRQLAIQYKIKKAKFDKINYSYDIGNDLVANFAFSIDIDDTLEKGLFISGILNTPGQEFPYNYLLLESGGFLLMEDGNPIIISQNF